MIEAQEWERVRIARDLHDDLGQRLAMWQIEMDRVTADLKDVPTSVVHRLHDLQQQARRIGADLQTLSHGLHSPTLSLLRLDKSLKRLCTEVGTRFDITVEFASSRIPRLVPAEVSLCLFRVLQEALHNAVKHSRTPHISVRLTGTPGAIELRVRDFGIGLSPKATRATPGIGLVTMRERVAMVNGTLSISSPAEGGTELDVRIPL